MTTRVAAAHPVAAALSRLGWCALVIAVIVGGYALLALPVTGWITNPAEATAVVGGVVALLVGGIRLVFPQLLSYEPTPPRPRSGELLRNVWGWALLALTLTFLAGQATAVTLYGLVGSAGFDRHLEAEQASGPGLVLMLTLLVAPLSEEAMFRGLAYPLLRKQLSIATSTLITALLFAGMHGNLVQAVATVPLGLILALVAERTRRLWHVVVLHAAYNLAALITPFEVVQALAAPQYCGALATAWVVCVGFLFVCARSGGSVTDSG
ncbi:CPBP family intramembrane metalloprotease [Kribbella qitaiheensis]|uniref:CPBP family intramembrane metalloprotease n=1 Tax=Kribbella qitaiheensis TaxID=1544730 RepID=A0A7G6WVV0_9ACTN|nr:CPBP family intramembrane glutamic endopeptidase [Kribbella qitaiheensis]QNE18115.1 CPBP family intramembrane metalloprotease [Kribbella qitaiheensis]